MPTYPNHQESSNTPRRKLQAADVVTDIRKRLLATSNFDDQRVLFGLAIDLLRRREREGDAR